MFSPRHPISHAVRSPQVWIIAVLLGFIVLEAAVLCFNHSDDSHHNRYINRKSTIILEVLKKMGYDLTKADFNFKDLELRVEDQNKKIDALQCSLHMKENEVWKLRHELMKRDREAELASKKQLLDDATELIRKQEEKLEELQTALGEKTRIERKMKNIEANLEKQAIVCFSAQEELKALAEKVVFIEKNAAELHKQNIQMMSYMNNSEEELFDELKELRNEKLNSCDAHSSPQGIEYEPVLINADFSEVQNALGDARIDIANLKRLMKSKEQEIIEATTRLKEEENRIITMQVELHDMKVKFHGAVSLAEKMAKWVNELVVSMKNDEEYCVGMETGSFR